MTAQAAHPEMRIPLCLSSLDPRSRGSAGRRGRNSKSAGHQPERFMLTV